jgi:ferredoxin
MFAAITIRSAIVFLALLSSSSSFSTSPGHHCTRFTPNSIVCEDDYLSPRINTRLGMSDDWNDSGNDSNKWTSSNDNNANDWEDIVNAKNDGSFWSTFESTEEDDDAAIDNKNGDDDEENIQDDSEAWLDTLAAISAEEIEFNQKENERADKVRQMQEWGFDDSTIKNAFDVEVDDSLETKDEVSGMKEYREKLYESEEEEEDWNLVESHARVEKDPETGETVRQQMVYVDEHTCIGCYNCANTAQSTFFMEDEHGRARVFDQWGDDDDTIACAIETCPVDCIHYVQYDELVRLETERRDQNINFKARLVNQGEAGSMGTIGAVAYTAPPIISGNLGSRCNNCPSRGCKTCPMFGVGKNPEFEKREQQRKEKIERNRLKKQREEESKSVDL